MHGGTGIPKSTPTDISIVKIDLNFSIKGIGIASSTPNSNESYPPYMVVPALIYIGKRN